MAEKNLMLTKKRSDFSQSELMDFIYCLNDNMKKYDSDVESAMERADKAEWDCLKSARYKGVSIQYAECRK